MTLSEMAPPCMKSKKQQIINYDASLLLRSISITDLWYCYLSLWWWRSDLQNPGSGVLTPHPYRYDTPIFRCIALTDSLTLPLGCDVIKTSYYSPLRFQHSISAIPLQPKPPFPHLLIPPSFRSCSILWCLGLRYCNPYLKVVFRPMMLVSLSFIFIVLLAYDAIISL